MGIYLSAPKTEKASEDGENGMLRFGLSSMQGWRASMEDAHAAHPYLDESTSYFGVYDGHGGKAVSKLCAKFLHQQVLRHEAYLAGDIATSLQKSFLIMDEMMRGQRGWRELAVLGDKMEKFSGMLEGLYGLPRVVKPMTVPMSGLLRRDPIPISVGQTLEAQLVWLSSEETNLLLQMLVILDVCYQGKARHTSCLRITSLTLNLRKTLRNWVYHYMMVAMQLIFFMIVFLLM